MRLGLRQELAPRQISAVLQKVRGDLRTSVNLEEFPLTQMSSAVAQRLWSVKLSSDNEELRGLDVGTGSGVHALVMLTRGLDYVEAIDIDAFALRGAGQRLERLAEELGIDLTDEESGRNRASFTEVSVDEFQDSDRFDLISFNPPAFYPFMSSRNSPASKGVFVDGAAEEFGNVEASFLFRFFSATVLPWLKEGGVVVCSWPALEQRVVTGKLGMPANPYEILRYWFGLQIEGAEAGLRCFEVAEIGDYGLGDNFWRDLYVGVHRDLYSPLLLPADPEFHLRQSFRYSVVCMRRLDAKRFEIVE